MSDSNTENSDFLRPIPWPKNLEELTSTNICPSCNGTVYETVCKNCGLRLSGQSAQELAEVSAEAGAKLQKRLELIAKLRLESKEYWTEQSRLAVNLAAQQATEQAVTNQLSTEQAHLHKYPAFPAKQTPTLDSNQSAYYPTPNSYHQTQGHYQTQYPNQYPAQPQAHYPQSFENAGSGSAAKPKKKRSGVQLLLLTLGIILISVTAIFFLLLAYFVASDEIRSLLIAVVSLVLLGFAIWLHRKQLSGTAEGLSWLGALLLFADVWFIRGSEAFGSQTIQLQLFLGLGFLLLSGLLFWHHKISGLSTGSIASALLLPASVFLLGFGLSQNLTQNAQSWLAAGLAALACLSYRFWVGNFEIHIIRIQGLIFGLYATVLSPFVYDLSSPAEEFGIFSYRTVFVFVLVTAGLLAILALDSWNSKLSASNIYLQIQVVLFLLAITLLGNTLINLFYPATTSFAWVQLAWVLAISFALWLSYQRKSSKAGLESEQQKPRSKASKTLLTASIAMSVITSVFVLRWLFSSKLVMVTAWATNLYWKISAADPIVANSVISASNFELTVSSGLIAVYSLAILALFKGLPVVKWLAALTIAVSLSTLTLLLPWAWLSLTALAALGIGALLALRFRRKEELVFTVLSAFFAVYLLMLSVAVLEVWPVFAILGLAILVTARVFTAGKTVVTLIFSGLAVFSTIVLVPIIPRYLVQQGYLADFSYEDGMFCLILATLGLLIWFALNPISKHRLETQIFSWALFIFAIGLSLSWLTPASAFTGQLTQEVMKLIVFLALGLTSILIMLWYSVKSDFALKVVGAVAAVGALVFSAQAATELLGADHQLNFGQLFAAITLLLLSLLSVAVLARLSNKATRWAWDITVLVATAILAVFQSLDTGPQAWLALFILAIIPVLIASSECGLFRSSALRVQIAWLSIPLLSLAFWKLLLSNQVSEAEFYTLPVALLLFAVLGLLVLFEDKPKLAATWKPAETTDASKAEPQGDTNAELNDESTVGISTQLVTSLKSFKNFSVRSLLLWAGLALAIVPTVWLSWQDDNRAWLASLALSIIALGALGLKESVFRIPFKFSILLASGFGSLLAASLAASANFSSGLAVSDTLILITPLVAALIIAIILHLQSSFILRDIFSALVIVLITLQALLYCALSVEQPLSLWFAVSLLGFQLLAAVTLKTTRPGAAATLVFYLSLIAALITAGVSWFTVPEPKDLVTIIAGIALLSAGAIRLHQAPKLRSWEALGVGLFVLFVPSFSYNFYPENELWRVVSLGLVALLILLWGIFQRLQAPLLLGALVLLAHSLAQLWPWLTELYRNTEWWIWPGVGGIILLILALRYEKNVRDLKQAGLQFSKLR